MLQKFGLSLLGLVGSSMLLSAQTLLPYCQDHGQCGYIDAKTKKIIINCDYSYVFPFDETGIARVFGQDEKQYFVDKKGNKLLNGQGFHVLGERWHQGLVYACANKGQLDNLAQSPQLGRPCRTVASSAEFSEDLTNIEGAVLNLQGQVLLRNLEAIFDVYDFPEIMPTGLRVEQGLIWFANEEEWNGDVWDSSGKCLFPDLEPQAKLRVVDAKQGYFSLHDERGAALINRQGQMLIPFGLLSDIRGYAEGYFMAAIPAANPDDMPLWGFINAQGRWLVEPQYGHVQAFSEGLAAVGTWDAATERLVYNYIDLKGKALNLPPLSQAYPFSEGFAAVVLIEGPDEPLEGYLHLIDRSGNWVLKEKMHPFYPLVGDYRFKNGRMPIQDLRGGVGFINPKGEWVIEPYLSGNFIIGPALYQPHIQNGWTVAELYNGHKVYADSNGRLALDWASVYLEIREPEANEMGIQATWLRSEKAPSPKSKYLIPLHKDERPLLPKVYAEAREDSEVLSYLPSFWVWLAQDFKPSKDKKTKGTWRKVLVHESLPIGQNIDRIAVWRWGYILEP